MPQQEYDVGLALYKLDASTSGKVAHSTQSLSRAAWSHWALIFSRKGRSIRVELSPQLFSAPGMFVVKTPGPEKQQITYTISEHNYIDAYYFGTYFGDEYDLRRVARDHSMNGQVYSKTSNNCQHWAARYLDSLLEAEMVELDEDEEAEEIVDKIFDVVKEGSTSLKNKANKVITGTKILTGALLLAAIL
ncbi:hypothetical protein FRC18_001883 [Serendipita sp. 400]|nr:hypothetical protein FRC18_001883 [Serendipita sp. 400]